MKKKNEQDIPQRTFIMGNHQIDLLKSSKRKLLLNIADRRKYDNSEVLISIYNKVVYEIIEIIYGRTMFIDDNDITMKVIKKNIRVIYNNGKRMKSKKAVLGISSYKAYGIIILTLYVDNESQESIVYKPRLNDIAFMRI